MCVHVSPICVHVCWEGGTTESYIYSNRCFDPHTFHINPWQFGRQVVGICAMLLVCSMFTNVSSVVILASKPICWCWNGEGKGSWSLPSLNIEWSVVTELIPVQVYKDESKHSNPLVSRPQLAHRRSGHKPDLLNYWSLATVSVGLQIGQCWIMNLITSLWVACTSSIIHNHFWR